MNRLFALLLWAARDVRRRPFDALLGGAGLALLVGLTGAMTLASHALEEAAARIVAQGPSLVVRRVHRGQWDVMPTDAVSQVQEVKGVTGAALRTSGMVAAPQGLLTIHGRPAAWCQQAFGRPLKDSESIVGPGVNAVPGRTLTLRGAVTQTLHVVQKLPSDTAMAAQDIVVTTEATARMLLGIPKDHGSDLAVFVYRAEERVAVIPDIRKALPFPVQVSTRTEAMAHAAALVAKRSGWSLFMLLPALVGLALLTAGTLRERLSVRGEVGLLKALGWTTSDVTAFYLLRALLIGAPGTLLGMTAAVVSVATPGITWPLTLIGEWETASPPALTLSVEGGVMALAVIGALVLVPWITASLLPALVKSTEDPADLVCGG